MKFDKQFPSLKEYLGDDRVICVTLSEVKKHCLDKQKVKEAIEKVFNPNEEIIDEEGVVVCGTYEELILKELGLE